MVGGLFRALVRAAAALLIAISVSAVRADTEILLSVDVAELPKHWTAGSRPAAWAQDELYVLEFWATWCAPCRAVMPHMEALWKSQRDNGVNVIGINVWERRSPEEIAEFLSKQKVPPTYPIALSRDKALTSKLKIAGIPHAAVLRNGTVVWQGHPGRLNETLLQALREGKDPDAAEEPPKAETEDPYARLLGTEQAADRAAAAGNWAEAVRLQEDAVLSHPLQKRLPEPVLPEIPAEEPSLRLTDPGADFPAAESPEAEAFAALLGHPLPDTDEALTVVALWRFPWWISALNHETARLLPGVQEEAFFGAPFRLVAVSDVSAEKPARRLLESAPLELPDVRFVTDPDKGLFEFSDRCNYPFVAIFLGNRLLWRGALELAPRVFAGPLLTAEAYREAIRKEAEAKTSGRDRFKALRNATESERAGLLASLQAEPPLGPYAPFFMQYLFAAPFGARDTEGGLVLLKRLADIYDNEEAALEMLLKICQSWPELGDLAGAERSRIAERLAELNGRGTPGYAMAWYVYAADAAAGCGDSAREATMLRKAIGVSASAVRLRDFRAGKRSLPSR